MGSTSPIVITEARSIMDELDEKSKSFMLERLNRLVGSRVMLQLQTEPLISYITSFQHDQATADGVTTHTMTVIMTPIENG